MQGNRTISYKFLEAIIQSGVEVAGIYAHDEALVVMNRYKHFFEQHKYKHFLSNFAIHSVL